ncbi:N-acetylglutaminylglutamine synthetase [Woodsholea maritima]|uniref:N-acetylglutaminylglutamine synthetase n=1 Tax=Woodsholea maritima TaxID=240237 RepID=UPI00037572A6|nr:N-acetylglutaminylglutamine synthetase [Woodsholea maritima]
MTQVGQRPVTKALQHRLKRKREQSMLPKQDERASPLNAQEGFSRNADLDCGWGHLLFAPTFDDPQSLIDILLNEAPDRRDIAFYVRDPHVLLALAPQDVFLDPSHTYRLDLSTFRAVADPPRTFTVRRLCSEADAHAVNRIYAACGMVSVDPAFFWSKRDHRARIYLVAEDNKTGEIIGSVTGIDHARAFGDPEHGSSLWCLAVDQRASHAKIGEALTRHLAGQMAARGCNYVDLSVIHDNESAIRLYERLGFERIPFFTVKRKNPINEKLFTGKPLETGLNPYARIIVDEARRRGISVDVLDAPGGFFRLSHGGRSIVCRESLTELTSAVAMSRCDDKQVTRRLMREIGLPVPEGVKGDDEAGALDLLHRAGSVVVKPARGEQGRGVCVDIRSEADLTQAIDAAKTLCPEVIVETFMPGEDLRVLVIGGAIVAAALRKRPRIQGNGEDTIRTLIEGLSRRRAAATDGESRIPLDGETERCVKAGGYHLDDILPAGESLEVRRTANLHTGGTLHDVTQILHADIRAASLAAAEALGMPVVGLDYIVKAPEDNAFIFIEANERPGLANHEPQPVVERFLDLLFPQTLRLDPHQGGLAHA